MFQEVDSQKQLEFSHQEVCTYTQHFKMVNGIMLNRNTRCFTSYNERGLIVWNPETLETLFKRDFSE